MSDHMNLPTRGITFGLDSDADSVDCACCGAEVGAAYEADPDSDGGTYIADTTCDYCKEPCCEECKDDDGLCALCVIAEAKEAEEAKNRDDANRGLLKE